MTWCEVDKCHSVIDIEYGGSYTSRLSPFNVPRVTMVTNTKTPEIPAIPEYSNTVLCITCTQNSHN